MPAQQIKNIKYDENINRPVISFHKFGLFGKNIIKGLKISELLIVYIENEYNVNIIVIPSIGITIFKNLISASNGSKNLKIEDIYILK